MNKKENYIVILGAGITGLTFAYEISKFKKNVLIIEKENFIGGLCATINKDGYYFDLGSHRFHSSYFPLAWDFIKELYKDGLLKQKRKGILFMENKKMHYPPNIFDIIFFLRIKSIPLIMDYIISIIKRIFVHNETKIKNFQDYMIREVGRKAYKKFYEPYAYKLWGISPLNISTEAAIKRMSRFQFSFIYKRIKELFRDKEDEYFFYPAKGIGDFPNRLFRAFLDRGGEYYLSSNLKSIKVEENSIKMINFEDSSGNLKEILVDTLISTISIEDLYRLIYFKAQNQLTWRSLIILYIVSGDLLTTEHETYYLPEKDFLIGRVSFIDRYSPFLNKNKDLKLITIEIPCNYNDEIWNTEIDFLIQRALKEIIKIGLIREDPKNTKFFLLEKIKDIYPVYEIGWKEKFENYYRQLNKISNLYMIGRRALFLHCNIDHSIVMGKKLAEFIKEGSNDKEKWEKIKNNFYSFKIRD
ncbi:MAG: FAD-dependent oxidoreductase [Candidatus Aenigmatarchaeota archaeon]